MERDCEHVETTIVPVAAGFEDEKVEEMGVFGWRLEARDHARWGEAFGERLDVDENGRVLVKKYMRRYVNLRFARSSLGPHSTRIRELEQEYFALQFPSSSPLWFPILFTLYPLGHGGLRMISHYSAGDIAIKEGPMPFFLLGLCLWVILGLAWVNWRWKKNALAASLDSTEF